MVRIITDSAADISVKEAQELSLDIIPMKVNFGDEEYIDGITLSSQQFFEKLIESDTLPKTSQIPPFSFVEAFQKYPDDDIICITISKKLSGSYNNALVAAREFNNVYVIDSSNVTVGENILVRYALKLAKENLSVKQI
ncbi:MAG: DegV family protein, partial [Bacilli bacterium]|nr:DegV family protein [Bacilli bacterium]